MSSSSDGPDGTRATELLGGEAPRRLLTQLVALAPTNLEDPRIGRWEKPNYVRASEAIVRLAREAGLATRVYDPVVAGDVPGEWHGLSRPNVIADLNVGAPRTVLILAHYDVVPVPAEQLSRWKSPPHSLTLRSDGRFYGRGSNDDLGSGVAASLTALGHLTDVDDLPCNVRLLVCCDEETGGAGGIEAIKAHDAALPIDDPDRFLRGSVALIPDGSPETTAASSGHAVLLGSFDRSVPLAETLALGESLVGLHDLARTWRSVYPSPDWPDRNAPEPVITGRASVTQFDLGEAELAPDRVGLLAAHAETDAANQIARSVTLLFGGPAVELGSLPGRLAALVPSPFRLDEHGATALSVPPGTLALQLVGVATHGGYPHRGQNPVPAALRLLRDAASRGWIDQRSVASAAFTVDLRLPPEMELATGLEEALRSARSAALGRAPSARLVVPNERCRAGYAIPVDHPEVRRLDRILRETLGSTGVRGEYGGTDASALRDLTTPDGHRLPALVFGSMDPLAHIHDAEESLDPALFGGVVRTIERFVREP